MRNRIFSSTSYDNIELTSEPLHVIDGNKAIFPTSVRYILCTPIFGSLTSKDLEGSNYNVLIEKFIINEDMLFDWINNHECSAVGFKIIEITSIQVVKYEDGTTLDYDILRKTIFDEFETISMILNYPGFETLKQRANEIAKENELIAIQEYKNRRKTVIENNYLTWKMLNAKYMAGEFKQFEESEVKL